MGAPQARETHISTLFFTDDRVYKLLKPVDTGFLDHREVADRIAAAQQEFELNRRFAPDVYIGTADVHEEGRLVDRMIVMRRLPDDAALSSIISQGQLTPEHLRSIARAIAAVHVGLEPIRDPAGPGSLAVQRQNWEDSFAELDEFVGTVLDPTTNRRIISLTRAYLDGRAPLFERRIADEYVRDGHGDLLAEDIFCLDDGPRILDCLAFRDDLRVSDVLSDVAFLAMDLHRLVGPDPTRAFMNAYAEFTGEVHPGSLAHHYVAYRAHVRCKVSCIRWGQGEPEFAAVARLYHRMTLDQLERARIRLVLVGGGPGTGKTSVAEGIGEQLGWPVLSSDEIRKDLAHVERGEHPVAEPDKGLYAPAVTEATYSELLDQAAALLGTGHCAVLDASWTSDDHRLRARDIAVAHRAELVEIECTVDTAIARERVTRRLADGWNPSDATPAIVDHLAKLHDPWPESVRLNTSTAITETMRAAIALVEDIPAG